MPRHVRIAPIIKNNQLMTESPFHLMYSTKGNTNVKHPTPKLPMNAWMNCNGVFDSNKAMRSCIVTKENRTSTLLEPCRTVLWFFSWRTPFVSRES